MSWEVHRVETAPEGSRDALEAAGKKFGFVPNLLGVMAGSPSLLKAYLGLNQLFDETSLSPVERQVVILTISTTNRCDYCGAAHSMTARMAGVAESDIEAIRTGRPLDDSRLEALRALTAEIVESRGWPEQATIDKFLAAGYAREQLLDVLVGVGMKTLSNYTNHIAETPLDPQFASQP